MFSATLNDNDAMRVASVVAVILESGMRCALTGGLAIQAQLRARGRDVQRQALNDIDLVVESFAAIPESVAGAFLQRHVHPSAIDGKTLLQLVDQRRGLRVDLFAAFGHSLERATLLDGETGPLPVLSVDDLIARTTALVCGRLGRQLPLDPKHAAAFIRLHGLDRGPHLAAAWSDHRQAVEGTFDDAAREARRLLAARPDLLVKDEYSAEYVHCERCREHGAFRPAPPATIVEVLGYC